MFLCRHLIAWRLNYFPLLELIVSNAGGGNPNAALRPLLTNFSPKRATTSLALLVTLGSCESLRISGMNLLIVSTVAAAAMGRMNHN